MQRSCAQCATSFSIDQRDLDFYELVSPEFAGKKMAIPPPTQCPDCRQQRRAAQVNELHLYKRTCGLTGKEIISNFHPESPFVVYDQEVWYSDRWDPMTFGRAFDFSRPFFEQYQDLCLAVPHMNLFTGYQYDENCSYTNYAGKNKNCYLIFDSDENRDCYYGYSINGSVNCVDCYRVRRSELCHECIDCVQCYASAFLQDCSTCSDSAFLKNCIGCKHCLMCSNLRNKEYMVENKPVSPEEFQRLRAFLASHSRTESARKRFETLKLQYPQKAMHGLQNENVSGDYLLNSKNAEHCFDSEDLWDCLYCFQGFMPLKDTMDINECGDGERLYECSVCGYSAVNLQFSANCLDQLHNYLYTTYCLHCSDLFGCCGLRHKKYCILNTQYVKEEYEQLVGKIIGHMQKTHEWGEFFPIALSPFCYNESVAQEYYPLTEEEATRKGYRWRAQDRKEYLPQKTVIPDITAEAPETITKEIFACASCGRNFKIIDQELQFHRAHQLPLPRTCFLCRHRARMAMRNPRRLWACTCAKCAKPIQTSYAPERPEKVYCEECYLKEVY